MFRSCFSLVLICALSLAFAAGPVQAANPSRAFTLTPFAGSYVFDGDQKIDDDAVYGLALGVNLDENLALEGVFRYLETNRENSEQDLELYAGQVDLLYHFFPESNFVPYIAAGLGYMVKDYDKAGSDEDPLLNYGIGFKYFVSDTVALRLDARHVFEMNVNEGSNSPDTFQNLTYTGGLTLHFGGSLPAPKPLESKGTREAAPISSSQAVVAAPTEAEMVEESEAEAAEVKPAAMLDTADDDGDGILDTLDKCPGTPVGVLVDHQGCPPVSQQPRSLVLDIRFATGKTEIAPEYRQELMAAAEFLKQAGTSHAVVEGHTDNIGSADANRRLSMARAQSVRNYLVKNFGINPGRIRAAGFGEDHPVADNSTPEGRRLNRRVVLTAEP